MNNQVNKSLKYTPFKYNFGCEARLPIDNHYQLEVIGDKLPPEVVQADANANRTDAKISYKIQYDKKAVACTTLQAGDAVLLKRTYGEYPKMSVKWRDGYTLIKKFGPVNWVVENREKIQKVYHQDLIKLAGTSTEPDFMVSHKPYVLKDNTHQGNTLYKNTYFPRFTVELGEKPTPTNE